MAVPTEQPRETAPLVPDPAGVPDPSAERPARPTVAQLRAATQPSTVMDRRSGEHWAGRLYFRPLSPYLTRVLLRTPLSPNQVTYLMIACGVGGGAVLGIGGLGVGGLVAALVAALLIQLYMLLDCCDGEMARWTGRTSMTGVYLDRVGHYLAEAALLVGLGVRAQGGYAHDMVGGWAQLGAMAALGAILIKSETDQVDVARARSGNAPATDGAAEMRSGTVAKLRRVASLFFVHRLIQGYELSVLALLAAIVDTVTATPLASRVLVSAAAIVAALFVVLHLASVLLSRRLR